MQNSVSSVKILNLIVCIILLITFVVLIGTKTNVEAKTLGINSEEVLPSGSIKIGYNYPDLFQIINNVKEDLTISQEKPSTETIAYDFDDYLINYQSTIEFFADMFDYNYDIIIYDLRKRNELQEININNIGRLLDKYDNLIEYDSFEYGLIEYFYYLNKFHKDLRNPNYVPYTGNADYIEKLIMYYSSIYSNTDAKVLLSIGAAESGNYKVNYMLKKNNIYGGIGNKGLLKHNNIELGVLSYVRLLSKNYYDEGLNTLESIGRVYCPRYVKGQKQASSHWLDLVNRILTDKYSSYTINVSINDIITKTEIM